MRHLRIIGTLLCFFAVWMQFAVPVAALADDSPFAPIICSHSAGDNGGSQPGPATPHHHCLCCQLFAGAAPPPDRPAFVHFDFPVASPLRWVLPLAPVRRVAASRPGQPRGPPRLA